jgi:ABC transporter substrate binding protein
LLTNDSFVVAFMREQGLTQLATANGDFDRVGGMTMLVRLPVDVIVTGVDAAAQAAKDTTTTIPIVMFSGAPVETGLVASLARPGGNVTGLSLQVPETGGKRLELLNVLCVAYTARLPRRLCASAVGVTWGPSKWGSLNMKA